MKSLDPRSARARALRGLAASAALAAGAAWLPAFEAQARDAAAAPVLMAQAPAGQGEQAQPRPQRRAEPGSGLPRPSEVAGRYAVLRENGRDTLCMVTLSDTARGSGYFRAQLAPACRDNGIVVFDPIAWSVDRSGHISLQARKGHKIQFKRNEAGDWYRIDDKQKPLGLRRI